MPSQTPPELEVPISATETKKEEDKAMDPRLQDLQTNIFWEAWNAVSLSPLEASGFIDIVCFSHASIMLYSFLRIKMQFSCWLVNKNQFVLLISLHHQQR